jgi:hypothetical protein
MKRLAPALLVATVAAGLVVPHASAAPAGPEPGLTITGTSAPDCPQAFTCVPFSVTCAPPYDNVPPITGSLALGRFAGARRGTVVAFGGGGGGEYWMAHGGGRRFWKKFASQGLELVAVAWDQDWAKGDTGFVAAGCRPAAAIEWAVARDLEQGSIPPPGDGVCGLCVIGYSNGASQVATAMSYFAVADSVDAAIFVSGPSTTDIPAGCRRDGTPLQYLEPDRNQMRMRVDDSLDGGLIELGACSVMPADESAVPAWQANSLTGGRHTFAATTRFHFIWGDADQTGAAGQGITYLGELYDAGTTLLVYDCVAASHGVFETTTGARAVVAAILLDPAARAPNVPPVPTPEITPRCPLTQPA